ncbi:MAG: hypothetical protein EBZ69_01200 [Alphaproteobacteria bacterium]|nr:hypothetical protein [Alphaproteobacteria bacterium]
MHYIIQQVKLVSMCMVEVLLPYMLMKLKFIKHLLIQHLVHIFQLVVRAAVVAVVLYIKIM